ncbi:MAG: sensor histidine kinase [Chitinophagales bacterium]
MKNSSLRDISLISASILAVLTALVLFVFNFFAQNILAWWMIVLLAALALGFSFFVIYILMDRFIYRRIKLIYKTIHQHKLGNQSPQVEGDLLEDVEQRVKEFSSTKAAEIKQLQEMEKYRKEFLGDISHELKTPIFNTQGYLETLLDGAINNPEVNRSYLIKANNNLDRLSAIVQDLVKISQLESGELELNHQKFDIVQLIKDVFENHEMMADNKDIDLFFKKGTLKSATVFGDKKRIEVVLNNLILNAIKYGKEDEGKVEASIYEMDDNILIEITDNGPGIEAQYLSRLFDRFFRIDKDRSRYKGGNGLGLAICKHIIEAHKQTIHVRSTIDIGTTFGFTLAKK